MTAMAAAPQWRVAEVYLFDTCSYKCAYCTLAESGAVLDASQLKPYRDPDFIRKIAGFFNKRSLGNHRWLLQLTGGEPLLMPNLPMFCDLVAGAGNKIALYTAINVGVSHPSFQYLLNVAAPFIDYLMVSFHPEAEVSEDQYFEKLNLLKDAGHNVICRFIGHPKRLSRLDTLSDRCRKAEICFYPTPLFSPDYPSAYTEDERDQLLAHASSLSQVIQVCNGVDTRTTRCHAGNKLIAVDVRHGRITPCISVSEPVIGHLYEDWLEFEDEPIACPAAGISCICDVHFQQDVVIGGDDSAYFEKQKAGWVAPIPLLELQDKIESAGFVFSAATPGIGQTQTSAELSLPTEFVRAQLRVNAALTGPQRSERFYREFGARQDGAALIPSGAEHEEAPATAGSGEREMTNTSDAYLDLSDSPGSEWIAPYDTLRKKWRTVPYEAESRISAADLLSLSDQELLAAWDRAYHGTSTGSYFGVRGWYHEIYRSWMTGKKVLDLGCGLAASSIHFAEHGARVIFADIVEENVRVVERLCRLKGITGEFLYVRDERSFAELPYDLDAVMAIGSLINAPKEVTRTEIQALLPHLKPGGRWLHLAYPKVRWEREGSPPFPQWGEMTDGPGTPWVEYHDWETIQ